MQSVMTLSREERGQRGWFQGTKLFPTNLGIRKRKQQLQKHGMMLDDLAGDSLSFVGNLVLILTSEQPRRVAVVADAIRRGYLDAKTGRTEERITSHLIVEGRRGELLKKYEMAQQANSDGPSIRARRYETSKRGSLSVNDIIHWRGFKVKVGLKLFIVIVMCFNF
jgi:hypothetical protein